MNIQNCIGTPMLYVQLYVEGTYKYTLLTSFLCNIEVCKKGFDIKESNNSDHVAVWREENTCR